MKSTYRRTTRITFQSLCFVWLLLWLPVSTHAAASVWQASTRAGSTIATTPNHGMVLTIQRPKDGIWGILYLDLSEQQISALRKHWVDKYYSYVKISLEIDDYQHSATGRVDETKKFLRMELDLAIWEALKKGKRLTLTLPTGEEFEEPLRGSSKALQALERSLFNK